MTTATGQIWLTELDPVVGNEQAGLRPCLVLSAAEYNALPIRHVFVSPLTSRVRNLPHHVRVLDDGALNRPSFAMPEYSRFASTQRLRRYLGQARPETVEEIRGWLAEYLGLR